MAQRIIVDKDFNFSTDNFVCEVRATAVVVQNGRLLVQLNRENNEYILPGGHVKIGEDSIAALIRECKEELGADIEVKKLLWSEERFKNEGVQLHHISFYYLVEPHGESIIPQTDEFVPSLDCKNLAIGWLSFDELKENLIIPSFIKSEIYNLDNSHRHFITETLNGFVKKSI